MRSYLFLPSLMLLAACTGGEVRETLGLNRDAPDEFQVVSRPPLSVPKEFYLRPPADSGEQDLGGALDQQARSYVTGANGSDRMTLEQAEQGLADTAAPVVRAGELESPAETSFLRRIGADQADKNVRAQLSQENAVLREEEPGLLATLRGETHDEPVLDAKGEAERIRANKDGGKPVNAGEVKTVDPKDKSLIDRLFD